MTAPVAPRTLTPAEALAIARRIDQGADHADGAPECLLVALGAVDAVLEAIPGSWEDPNDPGLPWTRIVVPAAGPATHDTKGTT